MRALSICIIAILFSSCTRLFNQPATYFYLHVTDHSTVVYKNASGRTDTLESGSSDVLSLDVQRSRSRLPVTIIHDSVTTSIAVRPVFSAAYYLNFLSYGIGFLADIGTVKKYTYPFNVYPNPSVAKGYNTIKPPAVQKMQLSLLPPYLVLCGIKFRDISTPGVGSMLGVGVNYFPRPGNFYSFGAGIAGDPIRVGERFYTDSMPRFTEAHKERWYADVQRHNVFNRVDIGYGLSVGGQYGLRRYTHYRGATYQYDSVYYSARAFTAGASLSASFRITPSFYFGINYQPQFLEMGDKTVWQYSHFISGGFYWRVRLW